MPAPDQHLSPAELAALEHAFASAPGSDAYRPLAEAYLGMGRFMEAMVVCKKGIKGHPADASARVLLARIYAGQGRDAKALEELREALKVAPADVAALRLTGELQLKAGEREVGMAALRSAWEAAPSDPETLAAMKRYGVSFAAATTTTATTATPAQPAAARSSPAQDRATEPAGGAGTSPVGPRAAPSSPIPVDAAAYAEQLASRYGTQEHPLGHEPRRRSRGRLVATASLGLALAIALLGWGVASSVRRSRAVEIDRLLRQAREQIEKDSYASYQEAGALCQRILARDPDALGGHAYLAYVDAIRWGELGDGEPVRADLEKQLEAVKRSGHLHSHAYAAAAYQRLYSGDARGAIDGLQGVLASPEGVSPLLHGVLGVIEMQSGDLDRAREALTYARQHAPGDVRVEQMLAEQWRRRGQGYEAQASALYDAILTRLAPDHVPSLLGKAQLLLDAGQPNEASKYVTRVLQLGPRAAPRQVAVAHALRGSVLQAQGKSGEGDAEEQQALALEPGDAEVHDLIGRRKLRAGDVKGAVAAFQSAVEHEPARLGFYVDLASALMREPGGAREAVTALQRVSDRARNARVTKLLGDAYRAAGDPDGARGAYEKAIGMEKRYPEAHVALAAVFRDRRDYPKAMEELQRAVEEYGSGGAASAWIEIAEVEQARGAPAATVEKAYASALAADPQSCPALYWLGRERADRGGRAYEPALARRMLSDYVRLCPRGPHVADAEHALRRVELRALPPARR